MHIAMSKKPRLHRHEPKVRYEGKYPVPSLADDKSVNKVRKNIKKRVRSWKKKQRRTGRRIDKKRGVDK